MSESKLASQIKNGQFITSAELLPKAELDKNGIADAIKALGGNLSAVNVADNPLEISISSLAGSVAVNQAGIEPIYQIVTRDRNRIAILSDLLGAAQLGIKNILCLSGYHQTLGAGDKSSNVYDIDPVQLLAIVNNMNENKKMIDGKKIDANFSMFTGAVANPYLTPLPLNILRLQKKVEAGAKFIQTHSVFDVEHFSKWLSAVKAAGIDKKVAILASVMPLTSAEEAKNFADNLTDLNIPKDVITRLENATDARKEGIAICSDLVKKIKGLDGLRGVHIISGGNEATVPEIIAAAGL